MTPPDDCYALFAQEPATHRAGRPRWPPMRRAVLRTRCSCWLLMRPVLPVSCWPPGQQQREQQQAMLATLKKNDKVVTHGGHHRRRGRRQGQRGRGRPCKVGRRVEHPHPGAEELDRPDHVRGQTTVERQPKCRDSRLAAMPQPTSGTMQRTFLTRAIICLIPTLLAAVLVVRAYLQGPGRADRVQARHRPVRRHHPRLRGGPGAVQAGSRGSDGSDPAADDSGRGSHRDMQQLAESTSSGGSTRPTCGNVVVRPAAASPGSRSSCRSPAASGAASGRQDGDQPRTTSRTSRS